MLVLLALNNIRTVLVTLGSLQMFAVVVAWLALLLPVFTVATEPSIRMIKSDSGRMNTLLCTVLHCSLSDAYYVLLLHRPGG